jgi:hypothetical protein
MAVLAAPQAAPPAPTIELGELLDIVRGALTAPSGDNTQPWQFRVRDDGFQVCFLPERAGSPLDPGGLASRLALGAVLEAARLRALAHGLRADFHLWPDPADPLLWAQVRLARPTRTPPPDPLDAMLERRCTNRAPFDGSALTAPERLLLESERSSSIRCVLLPRREDIAEMATLCGLAERCRAELRAAHEDLHRWLRWTADEAERTRDGLDVRTLGIGRAEQQLLRCFAPWSWMRWAVRFGAARLQGFYARRLVARASAVGVLIMSSREPCTEVRAGQLLLRQWLRATALGLAFSPMAALPLLVERIATPGDQPLPSTVARRLTKELPRIAHTCGLEPGERAVFVFRIGRAAFPAVRALRRNLIDVVDDRRVMRLGSAARQAMVGRGSAI